MAKPSKAHKQFTEQQRAQIFLDLITVLGTHDLRDVAESANVSKQTLTNWVSGPTYNPHLNTILKVANALGLELVLRKNRGGLRLVR